MYFPSQFPFVHRGNMPKSNDKYILTGWVCEARPEDACEQFRSDLKLKQERKHERKKG